MVFGDDNYEGEGDDGWKIEETEARLKGEEDVEVAVRWIGLRRMQDATTRRKGGMPNLAQAERGRETERQRGGSKANESRMQESALVCWGRGRHTQAGSQPTAVTDAR